MTMDSLKERQRNYETLKKVLANCIQALEDMPTTFPWQRRDKEAQRKHCCSLLEELRSLAPKAPELDRLEQTIGGCSQVRSGR
jgi:hypothetical protein